MQNKKSIIIGIATVILVVAAFFVGKSYGSSHATAATGAVSRYGRTTGMAGAGGAGGFAGRGGAGAGATMGQVVSMDSSSITLALAGGGSKIILYTPTTTIAKTTTGSISDVTVGSTVTVIGTANSDGSTTATAIQIRPAGMTLSGNAPSTSPTSPTTTQ